VAFLNIFVKEDNVKFYPILFEPNLLSTIWGGRKLQPYKGLEPTDEPKGESWEVSAIPTSVSIVSNGIWKGRDLVSLIEEFPNEILGKKVNEKYQGKLPLLVKFLDAKRDLSIQVHPDEEMAQRVHGKRGKSEMWYVIDAEVDSHLIVGFNREISLEEYYRRIAEGTITEVLADHKVKPGDVFFIPAGCVHALCGGIMVAEVQQSSDVTYRIFDYNRPGLDGKPRELHTELAAEALNFHVGNNRIDYDRKDNCAVKLIDYPDFSVSLMDLTKPIHRNMLNHDSFVISMCIDGDCIICERSTGAKTTLKKGSSVLIPASIADYDIIPLNGNSRLLEIYIDNYGKNNSGLKFKTLI
jgi:mannose-6-phosphate isomerase